MALFKNPLPIEPGPKDKYRPTAMRESLSSQKEAMRFIQRLVNFLAPYREQSILAADGKIWDVLARPWRGATAITGRPFQLVDASEGATNKVRVFASTIAGGSATDLGFAEGDDPPYLLTVSGTGVVWGGITIDTAGAVTSRWIDSGASLPADEDDTFHVEIGTYSVAAGQLTVSNSRFGPIEAGICRNWFAAEAPFYGATFL